MEDKTVDIKKAWDKEAEKWEEMAEDPKNYYSKRSVFVSKLILKNVTDRKNSLEGACGAGLLSLILAQNGFNVYGYDISPKMIEATCKLLYNNNAINPNHFRVCVGEDIPCPLAKFQVITAMDLLPYIKDYDSYIRKLSDHLTEKGYIVASCNNRRSLSNFVSILYHIFMVGRVPDWKSTFINLIRTAYQSGGHVDYKTSKQVYDAKSFDDLFYKNGFSKIDELNLWHLPFFLQKFDQHALTRGHLNNYLAKQFGWQHIGIYQKL